MSSQDKENHPTKVTLDDIESGRELVENKTSQDKLDKIEILKLEVEARRELIENLKTDRELRKKLAERVLRYLEIYSVCVLVLILFNGFELIPFNLPESPMLALVGSTAVAAIGLVGFVAKGLFK